MPSLINFASDNTAAVHPLVMQAIMAANHGATPAYGDDDYMQRALAVFKQVFGPGSETFFVLSGTAANTLSLRAMLQSYEAVICADSAHIQGMECGVAENFTGSKLLTVPTLHDKLTVEGIKPFLNNIGNPHKVQPKVISISQATEFGVVCTPGEIKTLADFAHANGLYLHMDGARVANAVVSLDMTFKALTADLGVDILSFGGTKNGLMIADAVVILRPALAKSFAYMRTQALQLIAKMRYIAAQFLAYFEQDLWRKNAQHANTLAQRLANGLQALPQVQLTHPVAVNMIFVKLPKALIPALRHKYAFHVWNEAEGEVRLLTSFATTEAEVDALLSDIKRLIP